METYIKAWHIHSCRLLNQHCAARKPRRGSSASTASPSFALGSTQGCDPIFPTKLRKGRSESAVGGSKGCDFAKFVRHRTTQSLHAKNNKSSQLLHIYGPRRGSQKVSNIPSFCASTTPIRAEDRDFAEQAQPPAPQPCAISWRTDTRTLHEYIVSQV